MRIKLNKSDWRLVGQKMGWLKRAQITTNNVAGVGSTGAAGAMGIGPGKITPGSLGQNTGKVQELLTGVQVEILKEIDRAISNMNYYGDIKIWSAMHNYTEHNYTERNHIEETFGSIRNENNRRSGPVTFESLEEALESWPMPLNNIDEKLEQGRNKIQTNNYTPAQLQRFEKAVAERRQKLESAKVLVRNAFRTFMASKGQIQIHGKQRSN